jgi:hypothetical protein
MFKKSICNVDKDLTSNSPFNSSNSKGIDFINKVDNAFLFCRCSTSCGVPICW